MFAWPPAPLLCSISGMKLPQSRIVAICISLMVAILLIITAPDVFQLIMLKRVQSSFPTRTSIETVFNGVPDGEAGEPVLLDLIVVLIDIDGTLDDVPDGPPEEEPGLELDYRVKRWGKHQNLPHGKAVCRFANGDRLEFDYEDGEWRQFSLVVDGAVVLEQDRE